MVWTSNFNKNKKASSVIDIIFIMVVLLVVGIGFFIIKLTFDGVNTDLLADDDLTTQSKEVLSAGNDDFTNWADAGFGLVFFGLMLSILITSFLIDSHPIFLVISIIMFIFIIFIGANVVNVFYDTVGESDFNSLQSSFPITMFIMDNLILLITITFTLTLIILYGKSNSNGGVQ